MKNSNFGAVDITFTATMGPVHGLRLDDRVMCGQRITPSERSVGAATRSVPVTAAERFLATPAHRLALYMPDGATTQRRHRWVQCAWSIGEGVFVALYLIEREFAEALELGSEDVLGIVAVNDDVGVRWVYSFLSADKRKSYCLYEADSEAAIIEAARRNNVPADVIVRVDQLRPEEVMAPPR
jgi:hypothetical protein